MGVSVTAGSRPVFVCFIKDPSIPMRSTNPFAKTVSLSMSKSWYFKDELPQLMTKIFIATIPSHS